MSNYTGEKLDIQTPWAKFCRNVYFQKILQTSVEEGIRILIENYKDWYFGMTDEQFDSLISLVHFFNIQFNIQFNFH